MSQSTLDSNGLGVSRSRADHPLFPRRTTSLPMNNAFSRGNRYADCRSVPTYTPPLSLSFPLSLPLSLSPSFGRLFSFVWKSRGCGLAIHATEDLGQWKSHISLFPCLFFLIFAFIAVDERDDEARRRAGCLKSEVGFKGRRNPRA